jgi:putative effector of murein hydrolase
VVKVLSIIIGGFIFTLFTTAWSVLGIRKFMGKKTSDTRADELIASPPTLIAQSQPKAFSKTSFRTLKLFAWISGIGTIVQLKNSPSSKFINLLQSSFLLFITLSSFVFGANLPTSFTKVVHPLVTCTGLTWLAANLLSQISGTTFLHTLQLYKRGTLSPLSAGAGDVLLFLLGPAVVALSCQMYGRKKLMRENMSEVAASTMVSSIGGLYGTAIAVRLMGIANPDIRLSLLSRNITSPLAIAIASILGADVSLAVTIVVLTGLFGANFGASILDAAGITDAVARGLGVGAAAHGLGTAAFANEKDAFPFAAIGMALTASACTVLVSLPWVKKSVLSLAIGV